MFCMGAEVFITSVHTVVIHRIGTTMRDVVRSYVVGTLSTNPRTLHRMYAIGVSAFRTVIFPVALLEERAFIVSPYAYMV